MKRKFKNIYYKFNEIIGFQEMTIE